MELPFTGVGFEHLHFLKAPNGFYYCVDVVWFGGRIHRIDGYGRGWTYGDAYLSLELADAGKAETNGR